MEPEQKPVVEVRVYTCHNHQNRIWWEAGIIEPGRPYAANISAVCWRNYKTNEEARLDGIATCKRLFPNAEVLG